ncbi:MAG TPA: FAD-dependent monooxygenase [Actinophytocola sp.]|jgi:2-polyprenyl-6-methoxyphenol hydroxylase-like FAD-dependent oxidoreductase|uniref:FAD-dependent monooxygenase n=1 Tax=Actinophytocola sp. TaxID=1872138 RepID=UPI002F91D469
MAAQRVPVLIVGGSLVGLSMSVLLASRGLPHLLVERHRGTAIHPRAAAFHQRTMEIFRGVGLQDTVEAAAAQEFVQNGAIVAVESLAGRELKYFFSSFNAGVEHLSPTSRIFLTQVGLEPVLRRRAEELGAEHRFATELAGFEQHDDGVTCVLRSRDGAEETVVARYVVAADGAHSGVRQQLGIDMLGPGTFADCVTIYFHANVKDVLGERNLSVVYVNHPELLGFFRFSITADSGFLAVFATTRPDGTLDREVGRDLSPQRCAGLVRTALGVPDLPVEIDNVQRWQAEAGYAARYRAGNVFLAGDAAHVMPPTGGFGGNTGVADAHNLAWKLAMTLDGVAGPGLLDSYEPERGPIGRLTTEQAYVRYVLRVDPSLGTDDLPAQADDPSIELGALYRSAAIAPDGTEPAPPLDDPNSPTGRPGARAPHLPIELDGREASTVDLTGPGFTLLAAQDGEAWCRAADEVATELGVPLTAHHVGPAVDTTGRFASTFGISAEGAVVLRPDGIVAWRSAEPAEDPGARLRDVMSRLLARRTGF